MYNLTILGNNSAVPAFGRNPTAQVLQADGESYLIDCGEGTQNQLSRYKIKRSRINHIFISHLHGDHYFGLMGLLTSMGLLSRIQDIHIYAPPLLEEIISIQLKASNTELPFKWWFYPLAEDKEIATTQHSSVHSVRVKHGIDCWGFVFRQKKNPRSILPHKVGIHKVPVSFYEALQQGKDYADANGNIISNEQLTKPNSPAGSYAFSADTIYDPSLAEKFRGVDVLYHETTYLKDQEEKAALRFHSTSVQAAHIARQANVKKLLIGHFSSKYESLTPFLEEAKSVFENTELAEEGKSFEING